MTEPYCSVCGSFQACPENLTRVNGEPVCKDGFCTVAARGWGEDLRLAIFGTPEEIAAARREEVL